MEDPMGRQEVRYFPRMKNPEEGSAEIMALPMELSKSTRDVIGTVDSFRDDHDRE